MKVYFIYRNDKSGINPYLYAITDDKELKKSFMQERKKDIFTITKKDIPNKVFKSFLAEHSGYLLGRRGYETVSSSSLKPTKTYVYLTSTANEEMDVFIKADTVMFEVGKNTHEYCRTFKEELLQALNTLHYFEIYKFRNQEEFVFDDSFVRGVTPFRSEYYDIDSFGVFMYLYGNTLDKKGIMKL